MSVRKMTPQERRTYLIGLIEEHGLKINEVADLVDRSRASIFQWKSGFAETPIGCLRLLELELAVRAGKLQA